MKKKILIADKIADAGVAHLAESGDFDVEVSPGLDEPALCERIGQASAVIVRSATHITGAVIDAAKALEVIGRAGIGVDNIDVARATERGVAVLNTPDANAITTAELTLAHILSMSRNLPQADRSVREGKWERGRFMGAELASKQLGVIGYGTIGRIVASHAMALQMHVAAYDPLVTDDVLTGDGIEPMPLEELLAQSDYVTLHCPITESTRGIINGERISMMKAGARIINCARGGLVDEQALYEALKAGRLAGAALDVFETEPPTSSPLLELDNVVCTPHLGASTLEAQTAAGVEIARQVAVYLKTGEPINAINLPPVSAEEMIKLRPYLLLARRLGRLLAPMLPGPVTQIEVALCGDAANRDIRSIAIESLVGLLSVHMSVPVNRVNALPQAARHGISLVESRQSVHPDYHATVRVSARHAEGATTVEGTLFDRRHPRLIRINDYEIEAVLDGHLLLTRHRDQPGVVAALSRILAEKKVNISRMQLGIVNGGDMAIAVLEVSRPLDEDMMQDIARVEAINKVMQISL